MLWFLKNYLNNLCLFDCSDEIVTFPLLCASQQESCSSQKEERKTEKHTNKDINKLTLKQKLEKQELCIT